jgi:cytoskeleton protein RodZ
MILLPGRVEFRSPCGRKRETGLPSFGAKLKLEREKRKITLEQISVSTKIGTRMLQALEEDNFNQLPGGIFNRGFVRAYSRFLGLDEDQTIADYMQASGDALPAATETAAHGDGSRENSAHEDATRENRNRDKDKDKVSRLEASADAPPRQVPWGVFAGALLVVALALSFWSHRRREHMRQAVRPTPSTVATQVSGSDLPTTSSPTTSSPTGVSAPSAVPKTSHDLATASPAATPGEFTVVIQAREESWTTITADGKTISSELLPAGSERVVRGRKEITVKVGSAGAVDFRFNGKKVDTGGEYGEVKTVAFGPRGILPTTPPPPSTP